MVDGKGRQKLEKSDTEIIYQEKNITLCFARVYYYIQAEYYPPR